MNPDPAANLADVYVECLLPANASAGVGEAEACHCLTLHRVRWLRTLVSIDTRRVLCHFRAPDAESVRIALRGSKLGVGAVWIDGET